MFKKLKSFLGEKCKKIVGVYDVKAEAEKKEQEFVVPEPIVTDGTYPTYDCLSHDSFNVVVNDYKMLFRVKSANSKEVFRLNCTEHNFDMRSIYDIAPNADDLYSSSYLKEERKWHFICRVFVTGKDNYFYQYIRADQTVTYECVSRYDVQQLVQRCEQTIDANSQIKHKLFDKPKTGFCRIDWIASAKPGTYTSKTYKTNYVGYDRMRKIDSYEVINSKLYDEIIENL